MFRHWDTWEDGKRSHLFLVKGEGGEPVDLMPDLDADVPTRPWGGFEQVAVTPDGSEVLYTAKVLPGSAAGLEHRLRHLRGQERRLGHDPLPDRGQRGLGHRALVHPRRQDPGLAGHGPPGLRGRHLPPAS